MATPRTWRAPSPATRPWACRRSSWRTNARRSAAATWRARTSSTPTPWRRRGARDRERARRPQARPPHGRERRRRFRDLQGHHLVRGLGRGGATRRDFEKMTISAVMRSLAAAALLLAACGLAGSEEAKPELSRVRLAVGGKPAL